MLLCCASLCRQESSERFFFSDFKTRRQAKARLKSVVNAGLVHAVPVMLAVHVYTGGTGAPTGVPREGIVGHIQYPEVSLGIS